MKDISLDSADSFPEKPKKKRNRIIKDSVSLEIPMAIPNTKPAAESQPPTGVTGVTEEATKQTIANIVQNTIDKYGAATFIDPYKNTRNDFEHIQPMLSEFLDDFIVIGHSLDGQRVVIRCAKTPGDLDKLTELFRREFI